MYARSLSVLICTGIPMMVMASNRCMVTELIFTELKAVAHRSLDYISMTHFNFPNSEKLNTFICQILLLCVPLGLLTTFNGVGL